jgi:hypothetical protein
MELYMHPATAREVEQFINEPSHAMAIVGQPGAGKTALAEHIAQSVLQLENVVDAPEVFRLDASDGDGIAGVRSIRKFLSLKTTGQANIRRVVIVEQADALGTDAQNALLKTLEEPPTDTLIILTLNQLSHVLPTIRSRVRTVRILPLTKDQCLALKGYDAALLEKAYNLSGGFPGLCVGLLTSESEHAMTAAVDMAKQFLKQSPYERLASLDTYTKNKEQAEQLLTGLELCLHAALRTANANSVSSLHKKLAMASKAQSQLSHNVQSKLVLTTLAIQL